jgi:ankyrin repeat protein
VRHIARNDFEELDKALTVAKDASNKGSVKSLTANLTITVKLPSEVTYDLDVGVPDPEKITRCVPTNSLTLFHVAALVDALECFVLLYRAEPNGLSRLSADDYTCLHYACVAGSLEVVTYIMSLPGHDLCSHAAGGVRSCLELAAESGDLRIVRLVLARCALADDSAGKAIEVVLRKHDVETLQLIIAGVPKEQIGADPLTQAVRQRNYDAVPILIGCGIDPAARNSKNETALALACGQGHVETVRLLCSKLLILDPPAGAGACHYVCQCKNLAIAKVILQGAHALDVS